MNRLASVGHLVLFLGFWLPSAAVGCWLGGRLTPTRYRALSTATIVLSVAFAWAFLWVRLNMALAGRYTPSGPTDPADVPAMLAVSLLAMAVVIVIPGGVLASYIAMYFRRRKLLKAATR